MKILLSLCCEGYDADFQQTLGPEDREVGLKSDIWIKRKDIPSYFQDELATSAVNFFFRWQRMGFPYGPWGENPNILIEIVETLEPIYRLYNPPRSPLQ